VGDEVELLMQELVMLKKQKVKTSPPAFKETGVGLLERNRDNV